MMSVRVKSWGSNEGRVCSSERCTKNAPRVEGHDGSEPHHADRHNVWGLTDTPHGGANGQREVYPLKRIDGDAEKVREALPSPGHGVGRGLVVLRGVPDRGAHDADEVDEQAEDGDDPAAGVLWGICGGG